MSWIWWHMAVELPLTVYFYYLFRQLVPDTRGGAVLAALPVLVVYVVLDSYYLLFGRVFRLSELREVPEALDVLPWYLSAFIVGIVVLPVVVLIVNARHARVVRLAVAALPLLLISSSILIRPDLFLEGFRATTGGGIVEWSDEEAVRWKGRLTMILYQEAKRRQAVREASQYQDAPEYERAYEDTMAALASAKIKRNLHLVVFEGFVDPLRMERLRLNQDPLTPELRSFLIDGKGSLSLSPVFGGYTAQAEFEILCGVPALQILGTIEFNLFTGKRIHCLPDVLNSLGYRTVATNAYKPNFFNAISAYAGTGFEESYFSREYAPHRETYLTTGEDVGEKYMFDQVLFEQNLAFVRERLQSEPDRPLLNYILSIYGHYPYKINDQLRPRVVTAQGKPQADGELMVIVNQIHYRSLALAAFIKKLVALDPDGVIVIVADHLPPLEHGKAAYERLGYLGNAAQSDYSTFLTVIDRGKPVRLGPIHQYDLSRRIYDLLIDGGFCGESRCRERSENELRDAYLQVMAHAVADVE